MKMLFAETPAPKLNLTKKLLLLNWPFLLLVTAIALVGAGALYSVAGGALDPWASRHVVRFCFGLALLFAVAFSDIRWWLRGAYPLYLVALFLMLLVPLIGVESGGARRWLGYGEFSFQPSEMMKIALVLALARYYQWLPPEKIWRPDALVPPVLMIGLPLLLALAQPDLGTAMLFAVIGGGLLFLAGVSWFYFGAVIVGVVVALPHAWEKLHDYQRERVLTFIDPERDPLGSGYHILQSKIAIGSGGFAGKGFMQGTQAQLNFLPEKHTDFIFTMFAEEMGFIGAVALLALYLLTLVFITYMALRCRSTFARLVAAGMGLCLFTYVFINVAMVTGLVPVVGVPLPLVSYGGTSMLTMIVGLGFVLNAHVNRRVTFRREEAGTLW
ncbi:rod shape-determining protein RodA [Methyloceanibacter superfactus]|jgi:rod shape determining protein RodA|uniref:Peptidoglycan glycosyltransferase MrdB n=1 Tax=Methyloceanibacter superfactus TaxID=1774969 RepID=A0A1E3W8V2_9HYPH|nr:rod shape-determining protein RodA [Methyloceanibacter superfactus]ODS01527.1 rod shape-determining protein RodA [Methyloceanibacter superfactus]